MRKKRVLQDWPIWRHLFDPFYIPRYLFVGPLAVGVVFATIGWIFIGWEGIVLGTAIGLVHGGIYGARVMLVRWIIRKREQGK